MGVQSFLGISAQPIHGGLAVTAALAFRWPFSWLCATAGTVLRCASELSLLFETTSVVTKETSLLHHPRQRSLQVVVGVGQVILVAGVVGLADDVATGLSPMHAAG
eukprot:7714186-Pyramimonas_sp.AAC.1